MTLPNNNLEQVVTYQASNLAYLLNLNCFVSTANTQFKNFEKVEANLGAQSFVGFGRTENRNHGTGKT